MTKKILFSLPTYSSYYLPTIKAFESLGYEVIHYDYRHGDITTKLTRLFWGSDMAKMQIESKLLKLAKKHEVEFFLTIKGESLSQNFINGLKQQGIKTVNWFPDPMNLWQLILKQVRFYDYFIHFDPLVVRKLKAKGYKNVYYLPFAAEIEEQENLNKKYDLSFIGTYSKYREQALSVLKTKDINIWGDEKWKQSKLKEFVRGGRISQTKMKDIIKSTRININLIYHHSLKEGMNLRVFEVTGSGGFLLTEFAKDLDNLFEVKKEVCTFHNFKQLKEEVDFYLEHGQIREQIAKKGYLRAKKDHNYKKRIGELLLIIQ